MVVCYAAEAGAMVLIGCAVARIISFAEVCFHHTPRLRKAERRRAVRPHANDQARIDLDQPALSRMYWATTRWFHDEHIVNIWPPYYDSCSPPDPGGKLSRKTDQVAVLIQVH